MRGFCLRRRTRSMTAHYTDHRIGGYPMVRRSMTTTETRAPGVSFRGNARAPIELVQRLALRFARVTGDRFALGAADRFVLAAPDRFAQATGMRATGCAGICSAGSPCVGIRPGRPDSAGFRSNSSTQRERAALNHLGHTPRVPASRRSPSCTNPRPPRRKVHLGGETNTGNVFLYWALASSRPRWPDDAQTPYKAPTTFPRAC